MDYTGTGNSLNVRHPHSLQLIMDSLRYWVTEMHVDGFRFDLASTLAREFYDVDRLATFFELVQQDPVVSQVKLIAEPWDIGPGGYQVGGFPPQWSEWNGAYRDTVRDFWRGEPALGEFVSRVAGSSDLYEHSGRRPFASINFVTAHDGFTLRDLVSYDEKHNEANGEDNNDGESHNRSWNHGVEGPTDDEEVLVARSREQRNLLATLLLSQGVPMILHGDELGRTQHGNNNTYAQDSEISWVHWDAVDRPLLEFTSSLVRLRQDHPTFRRKRFFTGTTVRTGPTGEERLNDIVWLHPSGHPMEEGDWSDGSQVIGMYLNGDGIAGKGSRGETLHDDHFLLYFNADGPVDLTLPSEEYAAAWDVVVDTGGDGGRERHARAGEPSAWSTAACWSCSEHTPPEGEPDSSVAASVAAQSPSGRSDVTSSRPAPTGCRSRRRSTCTPRPASCPTCTTSAWTGCTSRRSWRPSPARRTGTTSSTRRASTPRAVAPKGWPRWPRRRGGWAWGCSSTWSPTTSGVGLATPTRGGPTSSPTAPSRSTRRTSTSTGRVGRPAIRTGDELNYRRFFTIESLAGVRVEGPEVFAATHSEIRRWFDEGLVDGLRVDHPDGLRDPAGYLEDLAALTGGAYVVVEKILEPGEELPAGWATPGPPATTPSGWSTGCSPTRRGRSR